MYCIKCGAQVEDGSTFCTSCGAPLESTPAPAPAPASASTSAPGATPAPAPASAPAPVSAPTPSPNAQPNNKSLKIVAIMVAIIAVVVVAVVAIMLVQQKSAQDAENARVEAAAQAEQEREAAAQAEKEAAQREQQRIFEDDRISLKVPESWADHWTSEDKVTHSVQSGMIPNAWEYTFTNTDNKRESFRVFLQENGSYIGSTAGWTEISTGNERVTCYIRSDGIAQSDLQEVANSTKVKIG